MTLKAGEALFIPAGTIHAAKNVGTGNAAELATYLVEKGKPLVAFGPVSASVIGGTFGVGAPRRHQRRLS